MSLTESCDHAEHNTEDTSDHGLGNDNEDSSELAD